MTEIYMKTLMRFESQNVTLKESPRLEPKISISVLSLLLVRQMKKSDVITHTAQEEILMSSYDF